MTFENLPSHLVLYVVDHVVNDVVDRFTHVPRLVRRFLFGARPFSSPFVFVCLMLCLVVFCHRVVAATVCREIWLILDERERIDAIDEQEGQKVQDMVRKGEGGGIVNTFLSRLLSWLRVDEKVEVPKTLRPA